MAFFINNVTIYAEQYGVNRSILKVPQKMHFFYLSAPYCSVLLGIAPIFPKKNIKKAACSVSLRFFYLCNPSKEMWSAVKRIYQYLKGTLDMTITYTRMMNTKNPLMIAYTDADWSSTDIDHRRAVIGYIILLAGGAVSWLTKFNRPGLSSCETEYYGMGAVSTEIVSHTHLVNELKPLQWKLNSEVEHSDDIDPITIYGDNQSTQKIARHPHLHKRMKHTHIRHHVIRSFVELLIIRFQFVPGPQNCADIMVKASNKATLRRHRSAASGSHVHPKIVNTPTPNSEYYKGLRNKQLSCSKQGQWRRKGGRRKSVERMLKII